MTDNQLYKYVNEYNKKIIEIINNIKSNDNFKISLQYILNY